MEVVRRVLNGEKVPALSQELGIHRKLLYDWIRRVNEGGETNLHQRGRPPKADQREDGLLIHQLERALADQQLIIEFFRHALQQVEASRHMKGMSGATASSALLRQ